MVLGIDGLQLFCTGVASSVVTTTDELFTLYMVK